MVDVEKLRERYGASEHGNYAVVGTVGVPHAYRIGPKHVAHADDHFIGRLGRESIEDGEKHGVHCETCKGKLTFAQHEMALLVEYHAGLKDDNDNVNPELHAYLLASKAKCEEDKYSGFAFTEALK